MRKIWLTMVVALSSVLAHAELVWLSPSHDFGAFSEDMNTVSCVFKAVNTGSEGVSVVSTRANCGCTVANPSREIIAPGDTLSVPVEFNAIGRPGRFSKKVSVETSDGAKTVLTISGTVIGTQSTLVQRYPVEVGRARISGTVIPFGSTRKGRTMSGGVNIYNPTEKSIKPEVRDLPEYLTATFMPQEIGVGEQGFLTLNFNTNKCGEWGTVVDSFVLIPDVTNANDSISISTVGIINEDFSKLTEEDRAKGPKIVVEPKTVDFGHFAGENTLQRSIKICNEGGTVLYIRKIETAEKAVEIGKYKEKVMPGKCVEIKLTLNCDAVEKESPLNGKVQIISNDPANSGVSVRIVGTH